MSAQSTSVTAPQFVERRKRQLRTERESDRSDAVLFEFLSRRRDTREAEGEDFATALRALHRCARQGDREAAYDELVDVAVAAVRLAERYYTPAAREPGTIVPLR